MLHIISSDDKIVLERAISTITPSDDVLILGDIVDDPRIISAISQTPSNTYIIFHATHPSSDDLLGKQLPSNIKHINFDDFVRLSAHITPVITWQ